MIEIILVVLTLASGVLLGWIIAWCIQDENKYKKLSRKVRRWVRRSKHH